MPVFPRIQFFPGFFNTKVNTGSTHQYHLPTCISRWKTTYLVVPTQGKHIITITQWWDDTNSHRYVYWWGEQPKPPDMHEANTWPLLSPGNSSYELLCLLLIVLISPAILPRHRLYTDFGLWTSEKATLTCSKHLVPIVHSHIGYKCLTTQTQAVQHSISLIKMPSPHFI